MFKKILVAVAASVTAMSAFAIGPDEVEKTVELKDGSTVHVFKDGRMAMETRFGQVTRMQEGQVMEAKDGSNITMVGDEVARLDRVLYKDYRGGR